MKLLSSRGPSPVFLFAFAIGTLLISCKKGDPGRPILRSDVPIIDSISPKLGPFDTKVTIYGKHLGDITTKVSLNSSNPPIISQSATKLEITIPDGAGTGNIVVQNKNGQTKGPVFTYVLTDTWDVSTFAGSGEASFLDATGTSAKFNNPTGLAADASGNIYVADAGNHRIRKISPAGAVTTLAGSGEANFADLTGLAAKFKNPVGITIDPQNNLYVADAGNHRIRKITSAGVVTTFAGSGVLGSGNNATTPTLAQFNTPKGITRDASGNLYVADAGNHIIRKISSANAVTTLAGSTSGWADGVGTLARFNNPTGIAVDAQGNLYVADSGNNRIRKFTASSGAVSSPAGTGARGFNDAQGNAATFDGPFGIMLDAAGNLYVGDGNNNCLRKIDASSMVARFAGTRAANPFTDGYALTKATFKNPAGIVIDGQSNFYVADAGNNRIRKIKLIKH